MSEVLPDSDAAQLDEMHTVYQAGGAEAQVAPQVVYRESGCPHLRCDQALQAIDFRLKAIGREIHDPLVRAWWEDVGFAGRCRSCGGWIHFTFRNKRAIDAQAARSIPQLPVNWADEAVIL